jgi:hypothetical protein
MRLASSAELGTSMSHTLPAPLVKRLLRGPAVLSEVDLGGVSEKAAIFARDLLLSFDQQVVGLDWEDVRTVLHGLREPVVSFAEGSVPEGIEPVLGAVLSEAREITGYALAVVAFPRGAVKLAQFSQVITGVRSLARPDGLLLFAICVDSSISPRTVRVSLLTG